MPIRDFLLDSSGDLAVVDGDFAFAGSPAGSPSSGTAATNAVDLAAVRQSVGIRLRLFHGECFLDETKGVDYFGKILIKNPDANTVSQELASAISETPDVTVVKSAGLSGPDKGRVAAITYAVQTGYSANTLTGTVATT